MDFRLGIFNIKLNYTVASYYWLFFMNFINKNTQPLRLKASSVLFVLINGPWKKDRRTLLFPNLLVKQCIMNAWCLETSLCSKALVDLGKDKLQEWMEHWSTDFWKSETSRDNQKIISTSFEHLKKCINFQN